jgi:hypothetical protein
MHFPYVMSRIEEGAELLVYDGPDSRGDLLTTLKFQNETWAQSVTSTRETLYIEYRARPQNAALLYVDLVAGKSKSGLSRPNP